jgi:hypothetical protein
MPSENQSIAKRADAQNLAVDYLLKLDKQNQKATQPCTIMSTLKGKTMWVSGIPYFMTSFAERAFVFADRQQAEFFIEEFSAAIGPGKKMVHERGS